MVGFRLVRPRKMRMMGFGGVEGDPLPFAGTRDRSLRVWLNLGSLETPHFKNV